MLIELDFSSQKPIYEQLYEQIIFALARGSLKPGEALPAVRTLAEEIGINLHTVNKAYTLLKDEGYVSMDRRKGTLINKFPIHTLHPPSLLLKEPLELLVAKSRLMGMKQEDFLTLCQTIYSDYKED
ncbi:GntR family transcriptional regulator [Sporanaerobium hydrogeniformans]|uniref:GntR family transcriptional regulator n=1 Tax=Sporanaerobium hydrogeniformans TaxID=3072179 RepID=A0AC61DCA7_9FIRM|nr:GntR family transcriptional regulator [Sporanaerobium hydrogeniformans]PHV70929.1 GntR family transcriptional regulator [Sporanaerobium hydrogeniformans]